MMCVMLVSVCQGLLVANTELSFYNLMNRTNYLTMLSVVANRK